MLQSVLCNEWFIHCSPPFATAVSMCVPSAISQINVLKHFLQPGEQHTASEAAQKNKVPLQSTFIMGQQNLHVLQTYKCLQICLNLFLQNCQNLDIIMNAESTNFVEQSTLISI